MADDEDDISAYAGCRLPPRELPPIQTAHEARLDPRILNLIRKDPPMSDHPVARIVTITRPGQYEIDITLPHGANPVVKLTPAVHLADGAYVQIDLDDVAMLYDIIRGGDRNCHTFD